MNPKILPVSAAVVLALATASIVRTQPHPQTNPPPSTPPKADFEQRVAAVGLVEPASENISIASHLPGVVAKVHVAVGQDVAEGDPLVTLDTRALEAARGARLADIAAREAAAAAASARATRARAALADAKRTLSFAESVTDKRSVSAEEISRRRGAVDVAEAEVASADADTASARAAAESARADLKVIETDLERSTVRSPIRGRVLQVRIRAGEYAPAGPTAAPWLVLGDVSSLRIRTDIDEHEAWRIRPGARAFAEVRGNANLRVPVSFVKFEPLVVPKQSLTGASTERVDTRVLQAVYRVEPNALNLFVGQQMDVFIDASDLSTAMARR
jgi:HlyD family secretion protein